MRKYVVWEGVTMQLPLGSHNMVSVSQREVPSQGSPAPGYLLPHSLWGLWYDKSQLSFSSLDDLPRAHRIAGCNWPQWTQPLLGEKDQKPRPKSWTQTKKLEGSRQVSSSAVERAQGSEAHSKRKPLNHILAHDMGTKETHVRKRDDSERET